MDAFAPSMTVTPSLLSRTPSFTRAFLSINNPFPKNSIFYDNFSTIITLRIFMMIYLYVFPYVGTFKMIRILYHKRLLFHILFTIYSIAPIRNWFPISTIPGPNMRFLPHPNKAPLKFPLICSLFPLLFLDFIIPTLNTS